MINYLKGKPSSVNDSVMILVGGVGYQVEVGSYCRTQLNTEEIELFIYTYVREDRFELYGFLKPEQLRLFKLMIDISGVGPKTALDIVDRNPNQIVNAVQNAEVSFFSSIPRIGKKTAQKIILELKPKLGSLKELSLGPRSSKEQDIYETLSALGYEESTIEQSIHDMDLEELTIEEAVKLILKKV